MLSVPLNVEEAAEYNEQTETRNQSEVRRSIVILPLLWYMGVVLVNEKTAILSGYSSINILNWLFNDSSQT